MTKQLRIIFYLADFLRISSLGSSLSDSPEGLFKEVREESGFLQQRADSRYIKRLLLIKENQISQVKEI